MSSILAMFWPSAVAATPAAEQAAVPAASTPASSSHVDSDEFVMIDSMSADVVAAVPVVAPKIESDHARSESWQLEESTNVTAADDAKTARSCRPYGHAHKPPALIPAAVAAAEVESSPASSSSSSKRSFAEILRATNSGAASSSSASSRRVAYAQDVSLSISEQLLAKIEQLESALDAGADVSAFFPADANDHSILESINSTSPQLRPSTATSTPLSRESARKYDSPTNWTLEVAEPISKRAKHASAGPLILHAKTTRGPSRKQAKVQAKAHARSQEDKSKMAL